MSAWRADEDAALIADYQAGFPVKACGLDRVSSDRTEAARDARIRTLINRGVLTARPRKGGGMGGSGDAEVIAFWADRRAAKARAKPRACMCCRATFPSDGPHNRLCDRCRGRDHSTMGVAP